MRNVPGLKTICILLTFLASSTRSLPQPDRPTGVESLWDELLKQYVNQTHQVDYARLKRDGFEELNHYVVSLGQRSINPRSPNEKKALLINAYNAFTIQWVVQNYPVKSIWSTEAAFTAARHQLSGKMVSLDQIESELRAMGDPRIHAALVCAARSCPPLRREAYVAERLDEQLDDNAREWLANPSLNRFDPVQGRAEISPIFKWYRKDFDAFPGGLEGFLRKYAPRQVAKEIGDRSLEMSFFNYDWRLNDQSNVGENYSRLQLAIDWVRNWFRALTK